MLRLRLAAFAAASAALAACADMPTDAARAGAAGPLESTYASAATEMGCCGSFQDVNNAGLLVGVRDLNNQARGVAYTPAMGYRYLRGLDSVYVSPVGRAYGVNEAGQIVGQARDRYWVDRPVLWPSSTSLPIDLGELYPGGYGTAWGVNAGGMVVGEAQKQSLSSRAFRWTQAGGMVELPLPAGPSSAQAVNDSGKVVGFFTNENGQMRGFVWKEGAALRTLPPMTGGNISYAYDINTRGQVVGFANGLSGHLHAVIWPPEGGVIDLGTLGGHSSGATGISEAGVVVGWSRDSNTNDHAFAWSPRTGMRHIGQSGFLSMANAINRYGLVAGEENGGFPVFWRITETNTRPSLVIHSPYGNVYEGETGLFAHPWTSQDGTQFFQYEWEDAEGDPLYSTWSFGDGTSLNIAGAKTENTVPKMYRDQGTFAVRLIVTDPSGARDTATASVTIRNRAPAATFVRPTRTIYEGMVFPLIARGVVDGPADLTAGIEAAYSCGGAWTAYARVYTYNCPGAVDQGSPILGLRLRDKDGAVTEYTAPLTIYNAVPAARVAAVSATSIAKGGSFTANGSFTDGGVADGPWKFRYFWGDGTYTSGTLGAQGNVPQASHVYAAAGSYPVSLWITDKDGRTGKSTPLTVTVAP